MNYFDTVEGQEMVIRSVSALERIADSLADADVRDQYVYVLNYNDSDLISRTSVYKKMDDATKKLREEWYEALAIEGVELEKFDCMDDEALAEHISQTESNIHATFRLSEESAYVSVLGGRAVFLQINRGVLQERA